MNRSPSAPEAGTLDTYLFLQRNIGPPLYLGPSDIVHVFAASGGENDEIHEAIEVMNGVGAAGKVRNQMQQILGKLGKTWRGEYISI